MPEMPERLYFRQLLAGRDFARGNSLAVNMVNFVYLIGDRQTKEVLLVDPAYSVQELLDIAQADEMDVAGVLATHYHPDHVGGDMYGHEIEGVKQLLESCPTKVHIHRQEADWVKKVTGP